MKIINIKSFLILAGFFWVCLSFMGFSNLVRQKYADKIADNNLNHAKNQFLQNSKDLRFKLGQWAYNFHLVKTKGLDFDQDAFMSSEFNDIYFFTFADNALKPQWIKSKDISSVIVPNQITKKLKPLSKKQMLAKEFIYFSERNPSNGTKVFFGFPISDDQMGEGLIFGSLDLDYVRLVSADLDTYLLDSKGRFIFHPKKEYISQNADHLIERQNKNVFVKTARFPSLDLEFIYSAPKTSVFVDTFRPVIVMSIGLILVFGVLIFEIYMQAPINLKSSISENYATANTSVSSKDEYSSILKLNEVRDSLNQMSILSSVLKGRIDLAANGELNSKLFENIKTDFEILDRAVESTYRAAQNLDSDNQNPLGSQPVLSSILVKDENSFLLTSELNKVEPAQTSINSITHAANAFKDQGFDIDDDHDSGFESVMDFADLDLDLDLDGDLSPTEKEVSTDLYGDEFTVQLDELGSDLNFDLQRKDKQAEPEILGEGVVFQEYLGTDSETNDWAKIIEELTEEINTAELKPSKSKRADINSGASDQLMDDTLHE